MLNKAKAVAPYVFVAIVVILAYLSGYLELWFLGYLASYSAKSYFQIKKLKTDNSHLQEELNKSVGYWKIRSLQVTLQESVKISTGYLDRIKKLEKENTDLRNELGLCNMVHEINENT